MNDIEILSRVVAYESSHDVEDYVVDGWHVWPLLRAAICMRWLPAAHSDRVLTFPSLARKYFGAASSIGKYILPLRRQFARLKIACKLRHGACHEVDAPDLQPVDVILLTLSERRALVKGLSYEIYTDPFVDLLRELGFSSSVWEQGGGRHPQYSASVKIMDKLNAETILPPRSADEPDWFADYKVLAGAVVGREIAWAEIAPMILQVTNRSIVLERWLRKANPKILLLVCWYDPLAMSVTMSARRCGIKTVEIQHGTQGKGHFAYSSWLRIPSEGYEVVPDVFWCWGRSAVEELQQYNPAFLTRSSAVAGGNLWLIRWRRSTGQAFPAAKHAGNDPEGAKRVLVSLQLAVPRLLWEAISASPSTWEWMIRFHPSRGKEHRVADRAELMKTGHPGVEFERSNDFLLYELLNNCDVHVTECSSCAIEALAFGVQTVILGESEFGEAGKTYFRPYIEKKLMSVADTASDVVDAVKSASRIAQTDQTILNLFADHDAAKASLSRLLRNPEPGGARCDRS